MNDKKIIFMGTPHIAAQHLQYLIDSSLNIIGVFTQPPRKKNRGMHIEESPVHQIAKKNNLQTFYPNSIDYSVIEKIKSLNPDIIIVVAYGIILPSQFLNIPKFGCINIHVSLLPRWRGATPIEHALLAGDLKTGISVIKISPKLDAGNVLYQESLKITEDMYSDELTSALTNLGKRTMLEVLPIIFEKNISSNKQDSKKVTYAKKFTSNDRKINFNNSTTQVYNHIRAHGPKPGSWFVYRGERIKILKATKHKDKGQQSTILNNKFMLACNDGSILPTLIQREGKKAVEVKDFIKGFTFTVNDKINA
jgi:methionyl-tRNA formyltransferase